MAIRRRKPIHGYMDGFARCLGALIRIIALGFALYLLVRIIVYVVGLL